MGAKREPYDIGNNLQSKQRETDDNAKRRQVIMTEMFRQGDCGDIFQEKFRNIVHELSTERVTNMQFLRLKCICEITQDPLVSFSQ
jgi:hypothetical protein